MKSTKSQDAGVFIAYNSVFMSNLEMRNVGSIIGVSRSVVKSQMCRTYICEQSMIHRRGIFADIWSGLKKLGKVGHIFTFHSDIN